jgi:hypothetical protein
LRRFEPNLSLGLPSPFDKLVCAAIVGDGQH